MWEVIVCPKMSLMNGTNVYVCLGTTLDVGWQFYHYVQMKLLNITLLWYSGDVLLLKQPC